MKENTFLEEKRRMQALQELFRIDFVAQAVFELACPGFKYHPLLVIDHLHLFLSLSNEDHYLLLLPDKNMFFIAEAKEHLNYIQNRRKRLVILREFSGATGDLENSVSVEQITEQAIRNGISRKNLFLKLLNEAAL